MKRTLCLMLSVCFFFFVAGLSAQVQAPAPSPFSEVKQMVGLTTVTVEYSRPGVKERTIFGDLLPFNEVWRVGANAATKFTFSTDVEINGEELASGSYALLAKPGQSQWSFMFYPYESTNPVYYEDKEPTITVNAEPWEMGDNKVETFLIDIGNLRNSSADIYFIWESTGVQLSLTVPTDELVMESIESTLAGPSANDYYAAGNYLFSENKELEKAHKYVKKATEMNTEAFWMVRTLAEIQAATGDYKMAIETAKKGKELAMKADNAQYVKFNEENIAKWEKKVMN